jgi:hypothetical protein
LNKLAGARLNGSHLLPRKATTRLWPSRAVQTEVPRTHLRTRVYLVIQGARSFNFSILTFSDFGWVQMLWIPLATDPKLGLAKLEDLVPLSY